MQQHIALVLAAGFSKRYGSDKRFSLPSVLSNKQFDANSFKQSLIFHTIERVCRHHDTVFVIHRYEDPDLLQQIKHFPVHCIPATKDKIGIGESIAQGSKVITQKHADIKSLTIYLADMPFIQSSTIDLILNHTSTNTITRPSYQNNQGHPVCFGVDFISELTMLYGDRGAASVVKNNKSHLILVDVIDQGILQDIDTPNDWM